MSKKKHTPGPWKVVELSNGAQLRVDVEDEAYETGGVVVVATCFQAYQPNKISEERRANARLIAAAPDLLKALKYSLSEWAQYDMSNEPGGSMEKARFKAMSLAKNAIAKAEGLTGK